MRAGEGTFRLALAKGETMTLTEAGCPGAAAMGPVAADATKVNRFGLP